VLQSTDRTKVMTAGALKTRNRILIVNFKSDFIRKAFRHGDAEPKSFIPLKIGEKARRDLSRAVFGRL